MLPALFTIVGAVVHRRAWRDEPQPAPWPLAAGSILMLTALGLAVSAFLVFRWHDESLDLRKPTRRLVSAGPYRVSRNPVYLAFLIFIAGLGCANNAAAVLLAVVPAFAALNWYTIPHEEAYLRRTLRADYDDYAARVRRWIRRQARRHPTTVTAESVSRGSGNSLRPVPRSGEQTHDAGAAGPRRPASCSSPGESTPLWAERPEAR